VYECEKEIEVKAADMEPGKYQIHLKVQDNEGNWSRDAVSPEIWVALDFYNIYLPTITR
jgi:hypothetical protein